MIDGQIYRVDKELGPNKAENYLGNILISSPKRQSIFDMFPSTSVDIFPITIGVEKAILIAINSTQNTLRRLY